MRIKIVLQTLAATILSSFALNASANSISFDLPEFVNNGQLSITVNYDFTEFAMFGGGFDVLFDNTALAFVSYEQAPLPADAQAPASPIGALTGDGLYSGAGIGTFDFFNGMTSAGAVGTFVFDIVGYGGDAGCGNVICLARNPVNPIVSLAGEDVTDEILVNSPFPLHVPVPAAIWFMLSGIAALTGLGSRRRTRLAK